MTVRSDLKKRIRDRMGRTGESYTTARMQVLGARDAQPSGDLAQLEPFTAAVVRCTDASLRLRIPGETETITLRCSGFEAGRTLPGQLVEIVPQKRWSWRDATYVSGTIARRWTDVPALGLTPLALTDQGEFDPREILDNVDTDDPFADTWAGFVTGPRTAFEFDPVAWGAGVGVDSDDHAACLVADAAEIGPTDPEGARALLMQALLADLRCIDAHVHLGNLVFDRHPDRAQIHYEIAVALGELSLGADFDGVLPWGLLYNRPFLRALHGHGMCLWRQGDGEGARRVFERMMRLNLNDNQGARFWLQEMAQGMSWEEVTGRESEAGDRLVH